MALINVSNLTFSYDGSYDNIFEDASFQIDTSWRLGFVGRNGRGKTTFLNLLLGKYEYRGTISLPCECTYFPFDAADMERTTLETAVGICPDIQYWEIVRELSLLEVGEEVLSRPFATLSGGERAKALLAALFLKENSFLLIDEPTNHLDMHGREVVSRYLNGKKGFILVSHDRSFLDGCIDHVLSINRVGIEVERGNFSSWLVNKERRDAFELAENKKLSGEIKRLEKTARQKAAWSDRIESAKYGTDKYKTGMVDRGFVGAQSARMMKRAKNVEARQQAAVDEKSKLLKNIETTETLKLHQPDYHTGRLMTLEKLSIYYGERRVCQDVSLTIEKGDRVALLGRNGTGKSSILKLVVGEDLAHSGKIYKGRQLAISYVSQDTSFLRGSLAGFILESGIDESLFKAILRKLDFSRTQFEKNLEDYSGGQKKKVLIARSLCERSHLLVWDEPLNFIDVFSRIQIENLLLQYTPSIIFVDHDEVFCDKIATHRVVL
ncbi:MAG: ABC-F type ribosomal protection protein [Defluviitaleaceae bacterium]|nr:ABC-F type ribosomal protection protein [Defluviitaleaceae bacterium]